MILRAIDVFTPNDFPTHTYVERGDADLEGALQSALGTPNTVISVSGPSKSGKTVLAEKVIGQENILPISGAEISSGQELWEAILDRLGEPDSVSTQESQTRTHSGEVQVSAKGGIPLFAEGGAQGKYSNAKAKQNGTTSVVGRSGMAQVGRVLAGTKLVVFIDDFHYMDRKVQTEVAKQIRAGSGKGIKFCVASVPHRSDDVVRSNHELRGRTTHIDTNFWSVSDLSKIGVEGFPLLNMKIEKDVIAQLAVEACGSPQLMQQICLQVCLFFEVDQMLDQERDFKVGAKEKDRILSISSTHTDYSSLLLKLHTGPRIRGTPRASHHLADGSDGDAYRAMLLGLASGEPIADIPYSQLVEKTQAVCVDTHPTGQGIAAAAEQMAKAAREMYPEQRILEWDAGAGNGTLSIVDPYLLFYIRNSSKLASLGGV